jgi:hypothetical protein
VDTTGTLVRNKGVSSALRVAAGNYRVIFNQDVTPCIYQATIGGPTTGVAPGQITAGQVPAVAGGVLVVTQDSAGTPSDRAFFLSVFC